MKFLRIHFSVLFCYGVNNILEGRGVLYSHKSVARSIIDVKLNIGDWDGGIEGLG